MTVGNPNQNSGGSGDLKLKSRGRVMNKNPKAYNTDNIYMAINECYSGHRGVTVAKLLHAIVVYKDIIYGDGKWAWTDHKVQARYVPGAVGGRTEETNANAT